MWFHRRELSPYVGLPNTSVHCSTTLAGVSCNLRPLTTCRTKQVSLASSACWSDHVHTFVFEWLVSLTDELRRYFSYKKALLWRANARFGSAHARNTQDVWYVQQEKESTLKMQLYWQGVHCKSSAEKKTCLNLVNTGIWCNESRERIGPSGTRWRPAAAAATAM